MLIQFTVRNFRTFREKATLNLLASNYDKETRESDNIIINEKFKFRILKSAVVYGANASGKSKFMEALAFMKNFAISSSKDSQKGDGIPVEPFLLSSESENEPSEFEVVFVLNDILYRYGFEVNEDVIVSEWLFQKRKIKEVELFYREHQNFATHSRNFTKGSFAVREGMVRDNSLLLSLAAQLNESTCIDVIDWFRSLKILSGLSEDGYQGYTMGKTKDPDHKKKILELLKGADIGIQDIKLEMLDLEDLPKDLPKDVRESIINKSKDENVHFVNDILTTHKKYDEFGNHVGDVNFSMDDDESSGTRKFFALTGPILDVLENGYTFIVDELDSKLHPNLVCKIVALFASQKFNPKNAQLIFNTHNTNLLDSGLFRRDQVWFVDKNKLGEARLYSLGDFKSDEVRKTEAFEENYIRGKYGGVPYLGAFNSLIENY